MKTEDTIINDTLLSEATFEALLGVRPFLPLENGLLFYHEQLEKYVIATFDPDVEYTSNDYYQLPEEAPYQLIEGKFIQTMGASIKHQDIVMNLSAEIFYYVRDKNLGKVYTSPTDVVLGVEDAKNIFQPDVLFISVGRKSNIQENKIVGAPEFVVEVLFKSTEEKDRNIKMEKYGEYDVIEYWIIHPKDEYVEVYYNFEKEMKLVQTAKAEDVIVSKAIEGFELNVSKIF